MPFYFNCPKCYKNNYGYKTPPDGRTYYANLTCQHCGQTGIDWVASANANTQDPSHLKAVGAFESDIVYIDPTLPQDQRVINRLQRAAKFLSGYSQGRRLDHFGATTKTKEGQCEGQSLHWIRRVLQGGKPTYEIAPIQGPQLPKFIEESDRLIFEKQKKQHKHGEIVHLTQGRFKDNTALFHQKCYEVHTKIDNVLRKYGFKITRNLDGSGSVQYPSVPQSQAKMMDMVYEKCEAKRQEMIDEIKKAGFYSYGWEALARELDSALKNKWGGRRTFSNILCTACINRAEGSAASGIVEFAKLIVTHPEFKAGQAVLISVGLRVGRGEAGGSISGHAIAAYYSLTEGIYLFDPNIGVFHCPTVKHFLAALILLIGHAWTADLGWQLNESYGYAFFRADTPVAPKKQPEKIVDYSSSCPVTTTVKNRTIGTLPQPPKDPPPPKPKPKPGTTSTTSSGKGILPPPQQYAPQPKPTTSSGGTSTGIPKGNVSNLRNLWEKR